MTSEPVSMPFSVEPSQARSQLRSERSPGSSPVRSPVRFGLLLLLGAAGLILGGRLVLSQSQEAPPQVEEAGVAERVLPVEVMTVESVNGYEVRRSFTGEIAAVRASDIGFERSGTLVAALVGEGDRVSQGQPLAKLDIQNLETQKLQLLAQRDQAEAQLSELLEGARQEDIAAARAAVRDLEEQLRLQMVQRSRRQFLFEEGAISKEQLDEFAYGAGSLQARIDQAQSNLQELLNGSRPQQIAAQQAAVRQLEASIADLDVTIAKSTVKAPFDGIIAERLIDEGTVVSAGQPVVTILENATPEARIGVPSNMLKQLAVGRSVSVELAGQPRQARVVSVLPQVDAVTRTQQVVLAVEDVAIASSSSNGPASSDIPSREISSAGIVQVSPGQTARLSLIETIDAEGYWLPTTALTQGVRGLWNCYVVVPAAKAEIGSVTASKNVSGKEAEEALDAKSSGHFEVRAQAVEILHQEGDRLLVRGTLQEGDRIVADGTHRMIPGQPVAVIATR